MKRKAVAILVCLMFLISGCATVAEKDRFFYDPKDPANIKAAAEKTNREIRLGSVQVITTCAGLTFGAVPLLDNGIPQSMSCEDLCIFGLMGLGLGSLASVPLGLYEDNNEGTWVIAGTLIGAACFIPFGAGTYIHGSTGGKIIITSLFTLMFTGVGSICGKLFNAGTGIVECLGGQFADYLSKLSVDRAKELLGGPQKQETAADGDVSMTWSHPANIETVPFKYKVKGEKNGSMTKYSEELTVLFDKTSMLMKDFKYNKEKK
jgi:hypothetical protein